jgi:hypothetical protein
MVCFCEIAHGSGLHIASFLPSLTRLPRIVQNKLTQKLLNNDSFRVEQKKIAHLVWTAMLDVSKQRVSPPPPFLFARWGIFLKKLMNSL